MKCFVIIICLAFLTCSVTPLSLTMAWKKIIQGSTLAGRNSFTKSYRKSGGYEQAVRDFETLNPSDVLVLADGSMQGRVGTMYVYMEKMPLSLIIAGSKKLRVERVMYYKK